MITNLNLNIECQEYLTKKINQQMSGFILNINKNDVIVTLHHFLPIQKVIEIESNQELPIIINSIWSEFLVLDSKNINLNKYQVYKSIQNKLPKPNDELTMNVISIDNPDCIISCVMKVCDYEFLPYDNINTTITIPYIRAIISNNVNKFAGLSGSPVFINKKIVGIFSKAYSDNQTLLIIPIYVLIRNLKKIDNNNIYKFQSIPTKINKYLFKFVIPYSTYLLLEGDINKSLIIKNSLGKTTSNEMIVDTSFSDIIECNLIKLNKNIYLLTPRLLSLLKRIFNQRILQYILLLIDNSEIKDKKIWLLYDKGHFKII